MSHSSKIHFYFSDTTALDSALDTTVLDSDEARRIGLPEFLLKVQKAYHEYNREKIIRDPVDVKERLVIFGMNFRRGVLS